jgi:hypothetical protein
LNKEAFAVAGTERSRWTRSFAYMLVSASATLGVLSLSASADEAKDLTSVSGSSCLILLNEGGGLKHLCSTNSAVLMLQEGTPVRLAIDPHSRGEDSQYLIERSATNEHPRAELTLRIQTLLHACNSNGQCNADLSAIQAPEIGECLSEGEYAEASTFFEYDGFVFILDGPRDVVFCSQEGNVLVALDAIKSPSGSSEDVIGTDTVEFMTFSSFRIGG